MENENVCMEIPVKENGHLELAKKMAHEIIECYGAEHQNEIVKAIRGFIAEERQLRIIDTEKKLDYLKTTLEQL